MGEGFREWLPPKMGVGGEGWGWAFRVALHKKQQEISKMKIILKYGNIESLKEGVIWNGPGCKGVSF